MTAAFLGVAVSLAKTLISPCAPPCCNASSSLVPSSSAASSGSSGGAVLKPHETRGGVVICRSGGTAAAPRPTNVADDASLSERRPRTEGIVHLLREFGFDGEGARALLDTHRHIALLGVDSLRRRLVALLSAGISGFAVPDTVAKLPEILTSEKIERLLNFIANDLGGIEPAKLERLLTTTRASALAELPERIALLVDHGVPREKLGKVVNGVNIKKAFCARSMEEVEETILLLRCLGGGGADLILRRPLLLNLDPATQLIPRIDFLTELAGGDAEEAARLIRKLPNILAYTVAHIELHLEFWLSVGLTREQVFKVALVYPSMFSVSRERKLVRRVEFLRRCGLEGEDIFKFLVKAPLFLSLSSENLAKKLAFLVKIGYRHGTREMAAAVGAVTRTSCENLQGAVEVLLGYGFGVADVLAMSRRHPQVLQYNYESLEEKLEYLVGEMERDVEELLAFPAFLGYKLDDRIKHRYEVKKEVRGKGMSLNKLLSVSAERFHEQAIKQQSG